MPELVKVKSVEHLTHDVIRLVAEKPAGLTYIPGQAVDISINKEGWKDTLSCFTFVSLPDEDYIEFNIKTYPERKRVTNELLSVKAGDEIFVYKPFGKLRFKGDGIFIAGGAGITPFIAMLRDLQRQNKLGNNKLIFANKTQGDIIRKDFFDEMLGKNFVNVLSAEEVPGYEHGYVNAEIIKKQQAPGLDYYYLCGPDPMMNAVEKELKSLGIDDEHIVIEDLS